MLTNVQIYGFNNTASQKWKLVKRNAATVTNTTGGLATGANSAINATKNNQQRTQTFQQFTATAKRTVNAFNDSSLSPSSWDGKSRVDWNDPITVLEERGNAYHVQYPGSNHEPKIKWVSKDILKEIQSSNNTEVINRMKYFSENVNGFITNTKYTGGEECYGFASKVYSSLFGVSSPNGYSNNNYYLTSFNGSRVAGQLYDFASNDIEAVQKLFENAKPGSFVQMGRRHKLNRSGTAPRPHSAILYSVQNDGVYFYEANADGKGTIKLEFYNWQNSNDKNKDLTDRNKGFTIYEPIQYVLKV